MGGVCIQRDTRGGVWRHWGTPGDNRRERWAIGETGRQGETTGGIGRNREATDPAVHLRTFVGGVGRTFTDKLSKDRIPNVKIQIIRERSSEMSRE
eukprot:2189153-Pyramimonas_sp.AAC.1